MVSKQFINFQIKLNNAISVLLNHPVVRKIAVKYPKSFQFGLERFTIRKFIGLPLTLLMTSIVVNLFLLAEIVETVENSSLLLSIDYTVASFLAAIRINLVANTFFYFTQLGSFKFVAFIAFFAAVYFYIKQKYSYILGVLISIVGTGITVLIGKNYFHRIRPAGLSYYQETSYSFPSGHATIAVALYGLLFYYVVRQCRTYKAKFYWTMSAFAFVLLIGFSRLYLCVHYLTDVIAGYSLGFLWLLLAVSIIEWEQSKNLNH